MLFSCVAGVFRAEESKKKNNKMENEILCKRLRNVDNIEVEGKRNGEGPWNGTGRWIVT